MIAMQTTRRNGKTTGFIHRTAILVIVPIALACLVNLLRSEPLDWVTGTPYMVFVDCPEYSARARPMYPAFALAWPQNLYFVDARSETQTSRAAIPGAVSIPYDPLFDSLPHWRVRELQRRSRQSAIVVYGDQGLGAFLAHELASAGVDNVHYLWGGLELWLQEGLPVEEAAP